MHLLKYRNTSLWFKSPLVPLSNSTSITLRKASPTISISPSASVSSSSTSPIGLSSPSSSTVSYCFPASFSSISKKFQVISSKSTHNNDNNDQHQRQSKARFSTFFDSNLINSSVGSSVTLKMLGGLLVVGGLFESCQAEEISVKDAVEFFQNYSIKRNISQLLPSLLAIVSKDSMNQSFKLKNFNVNNLDQNSKFLLHFLPIIGFLGETMREHPDITEKLFDFLYTQENIDCNPNEFKQLLYLALFISNQDVGNKILYKEVAKRNSNSKRNTDEVYSDLRNHLGKQINKPLYEFLLLSGSYFASPTDAKYNKMVTLSKMFTTQNSQTVAKNIMNEVDGKLESSKSKK